MRVQVLPILAVLALCLPAAAIRVSFRATHRSGDPDAAKDAAKEADKVESAKAGEDGTVGQSPAISDDPLQGGFVASSNYDRTAPPSRQKGVLTIGKQGSGDEVFNEVSNNYNDDHENLGSFVASSTHDGIGEMMGTYKPPVTDDDPVVAPFGDDLAKPASKQMAPLALKNAHVVDHFKDFDEVAVPENATQTPQVRRKVAPKKSVHLAAKVRKHALHHDGKEMERMHDQVEKIAQSLSDGKARAEDQTAKIDKLSSLVGELLKKKDKSDKSSDDGSGVGEEDATPPAEDEDEEAEKEEKKAPKEEEPDEKEAPEKEEKGEEEEKVVDKEEPEKEGEDEETDAKESEEEVEDPEAESDDSGKPSEEKDEQEEEQDAGGAAQSGDTQEPEQPEKIPEAVAEAPAAPAPVDPSVSAAEAEAPAPDAAVEPEAADPGGAKPAAAEDASTDEEDESGGDGAADEIADEDEDTPDDSADESKDDQDADADADAAGTEDGKKEGDEDKDEDEDAPKKDEKEAETENRRR